MQISLFWDTSAVEVTLIESLVDIPTTFTVVPLQLGGFDYITLN